MDCNRKAINKEGIILAAIMLAAAIVLIFRSLGLYPTVLADEYTYNKLARLVSLSKANMSNYLYFILYSTTSSCGDGFLVCARLFNVIFFVSAAPFIYFIGREITGKITALIISALSMLGPINSYTAYFMPESMYFFSFWVFTWFLLRTSQNQAIPHWVLLGVIFGLASLIKPHAIFLLPALAGLFLIFFRQNENVATFKKIKSYAVFFASAIATKFIISFILAGKSGLTFFGRSYSSHASNIIYSDLTRLALENLQGHLLSLFLLFSVPVAQILLSSKYFYKRIDDSQRISINIKLYTALVFAVLLTVVAFFTASISVLGQYEENARLHMRLYNFAFPLLLLVAASQLSLDSNAMTIRWRAITAFPIGAAILYAIYTNLSPYTPSFIDSPELRGFTFKPIVFYVLSTLSLFSLIVWVFKARIGAKIFVYVFIPLSVVFSTIYVNQELRQRLIPNAYDKAGIFTKQNLSNEELAKLLVVGSDTAGLFLSLFHLDNEKASIKTIPKGGNYELSKIPSGKEWVLVVGDHSLREETFFQLPMKGFTLALIPGSITVDFKTSSWLGVAKARGLSSAEAWGTWSSGDVVTLEFSAPLPEKFSIHLVAHAFGPNVGKEFVAHVDESSKSFTLGASPEERVLEFINHRRAKTIRIDIPSPTSPKELGLSRDDRSLGIAFNKLRIVW